MFRFKWEDEPRVVTSSPTAAIKVRSLPASSQSSLAGIAWQYTETGIASLQATGTNS